MGQSGRGLRGLKHETHGADDVKKQVDSDDNFQRPIYQLVNVKNGGGKLVDLIKSNARHSQSNGSFGFSRSSNEFSTITQQKQLEQSVDRQIHDLVEPLLYNGGRGKLVPLSEIWMWRMGKIKRDQKREREQGRGRRSNGKEGKEQKRRKRSEAQDNLRETADQGDDDVMRNKFGSRETEVERASNDGARAAPNLTRYRWVCWKLEERGHVGETALHICFLLNTPTHMILAKKLLAMFPMLINDIYTCDEYFGESSLHMAIVNEDVRIVKLLLDHGANVHERCLGSFFLPIDQKDYANYPVRNLLERSKVDELEEQNSSQRVNIEEELDRMDLQSNHFHTLETNYNGYAYWGEYPLSFATCLGLADCYKLLLAKGANPNKQDSNGNASLHVAVIADRIDMFDLCYSNGADLNVLNKQKLSPLTLAAKLRRVDMFFHIMTIQRQVNWIFCNVGFVEVPLNGVDSINTEDGSCNEDSVLSIVVFGDSNEHLQMLDGLVSQLLKVKWETAARGKFYWWLGEYLLFMAIATAAYITRFETKLSKSASTMNKETSPKSNTIPQVTLTTSSITSYKIINTFSEYALVGFVIYYLWITIERIVPNVRLLSKCLSHAPEMSLFSLTCLLILACIPLRLLELEQYEDFLAALIMFTLPLKLLFFCRASKSVGMFVLMIYKILVNDVLCFVVFMIIFVAGFSQSFLIIFKTHRPTISGSSNATTTSLFMTSGSLLDRNYFINLFDGIISMHMMALNEFGMVFDELDSTDFPRLGKILFCVYMVLVSILLINMLIAMLGKTYQDIASQPNENLRQWARALLVIERMWTKRERLSMLDKYSHQIMLLNGAQQRFFGSTWALTDKDQDDISCLRELNMENKQNAARLARVERKQLSTIPP